MHTQIEHRYMRLAAPLLAFLMALTSAGAQDTRTVTEPVFPSACTVLPSQLAIIAGEPASETAFDTTRIQTALNACPVGQAVELQASGANNAFLIQPLTIPTGVTLLIDGGATVFASRNPGDYQIAGKETCGTVGSAGNGCSPILTISAGSGSGIMGYGILDGRGQDKLLINGVASTSSWWDIALQAQSAGGSQNNPILLVASHAASFTLYKITFKNSPMFHVKWQSADGFTAWGVKVATPYTARNSDGIDPSGTNITVTRSSISDGDDNVALSASSATANVTISSNNTYSGHGISVGSYTQGGLSNMLVSNINQAGTAGDSNGIALRIKSALDRGGLVQNVTYRNICMQNHKTLLDIDPFYNANAGALVPLFSNILFQNIHGLTAGSLTIQGRDVNHPTTVTFDNVVFDTLTQANITPSFQFDTITLGPGPVQPAFLQSQTGTGVAYNGNVSNPTAAPYACSAASFTFLVGELYASTATATNLQQATIPGPGTVTLNAMLDPAMSEVTYGAYMGTPAPTAAVQFFEGTQQVGTGTLGGNGTLASATLTLVPTGIHTYTASYLGDANYPAYSFGSVTITVVPTAAPSTTALGAAPPTVQARSTTVLTATITGTSLAAPPTGKANFFDGTTLLGTAVVSSSKASLTATLANPGTHTLTVAYLGDANNAASTSPAATIAVTAIPTTATLSLSSASLSVGATATLTVVVSANMGVPTGTVTFFNGTTSLGTATLTNGTASVTSSAVAVGTQSISAAYAATGDFAASTSSTLALTFTAPLTLSLSSYQATATLAKPAVVTVIATPATGYTGTVAFACVNPQASLTCTFAPASGTVSGSAAVQTQLTLTALPSTSLLRYDRHNRLQPALALIFPCGVLCLLGLRRKASPPPRLGLLLILSTLMTLGVGGCAAATQPTPAFGTQTVTISATAAAQTQTTQLVVNITN